HALGHRPHLAVALGDERDDTVGLAELDRPQHDAAVAIQLHGCTPPNRRLRRWYSMIASNRSLRRKSGHSTSVKTSSLYAISQRRKFEMRYSRDVRTTRSGSGASGRYRWARMARSSILLALTPLATSSRTAST